jgi:hypothetical protein
MAIIFKIITGIIVVAVGVFMVWRTETMLRIFGRVDWAEQHLGLDGGSRLFYKLLGLLLCFIGIAVATGLGRALFMGTVGLILFPGGVK